MACTNCRLALGGVMRGGARAGCVSPRLVVTMNGTRIDPATAATRILIASLSIHDALNEVPNTAMFTVRGVKPPEGAEMIFTWQSVNNSSRLFAGHISRVTQVYVGDAPLRAPNYQWQCEATDYSWRLNAQMVVARYRNLSATAIVQDLVAKWAPAGYTTAVQANLPVIDEVSITNVVLMDAIKQVAERVGGYSECDYFKTIRVWIDRPDDLVSPPRALTPTHSSLAHVQAARDLTQIVTRALVEGGGVNALTDVAPGATTLPLDDESWYDPAGGTVVSGPQRITYTGVVAGGPGTLVGPGVTPSTALAVAGTQGGAVPAGAHSWAYTWRTATGETVPSPVTTVTLGSVPGPADTPIVTFGGISDVSFKPIGAMYEYATAYSTVPYPTSNIINTLFTSVTAISPSVFHTTKQSTDPNNPTLSQGVYVQMNFSPDPRVQSLVLLVRKVGDPQFHGIQGAPNRTSPPGWRAWMDGLQDSGIASSPAYPGVTAILGTAALSAIPVGPSGTVSRILYRTAANAATLQLLATLADNTTTTYTDTAADTALGAAAPASDTSGLQMAAGIVPAGSPTLRVAATTHFSASGGWLLVGTQVVRYSGKTATDLTGIPASGPGSLAASIPYNAVVQRAAYLTGIPASGAGAIVLPILPGDPVNLLITVDDVPAQNAFGALVGGDGVQVGYVQDRRISLGEAQARGRALLAQRKDVMVTVRYTVRDIQTRSGAIVTVNLPAPMNLAGDFRIQDVQIGPFGPHVFPVYQVTASSQRFTFEDLLRRSRPQGVI
jgi:hypothetical protein